MRPEVIKPIDRPEKLLPDIFDGDQFNSTLVRQLNTKLVYRKYKDTILAEKANQINALYPETKLIFIGKIFGILSDPDPRYQDQRSTGLHLLGVINLESVDSKKLKENYMKSLSDLKENPNNDSGSYGEIYALLEAGKIIAPFLKNTQGILQEWDRIAKLFKKDSEDYQAIHEGIKEIRQQGASEFDKRIAELIGERMSNKDIASKLQINELDVKRSTSRLHKRGFTSNRKHGRQPTSS